MGLPLGTYQGCKALAGNPRGNRARSQDFVRNLIRPEKDAKSQGITVAPGKWGLVATPAPIRI